VEHAEMSVGFNYNDWIIIGATCIGNKVHRSQVI
jgi:hypothetical protein